MPFAAVSWKYRDPIESIKLTQMDLNVRTHDHRVDGTQGKPRAGRSAAGEVSESRSASGWLATAISFPVGRFTSAPRVMLSPRVGNANLLVTAWAVSNVTASGFTAHVQRTNTGNTPLAWTAIERA